MARCVRITDLDTTVATVQLRWPSLADFGPVPTPLSRRAPPSPLAPSLVKRKARKSSGLFCVWRRCTGRNSESENPARGMVLEVTSIKKMFYCQHALPSDPFRAFSSVVTKYSSRSRSNFFWVALKVATRAAISSRSRARRSCCSVISYPFDLSSYPLAIAIGARIGKRRCGIVIVRMIAIAVAMTWWIRFAPCA